MRRYLTYALFLASFSVPDARADFVLVGSRPAAPASQVPAPEAPASASGNACDASGATAPGPDAPLDPRFKVAQGFGNHIPLRFAVRQIVPRAVKVTYGPGADPDGLVDWKGGQGWNCVLFRAVHPLRLRLVLSNGAVKIRK